VRRSRKIKKRACVIFVVSRTPASEMAQGDSQPSSLACKNRRDPNMDAAMAFNIFNARAVPAPASVETREISAASGGFVHFRCAFGRCGAPWEGQPVNRPSVNRPEDDVPSDSGRLTDGRLTGWPPLQGTRFFLSSSSIVLGQSSLSRRDSERSASSLPPVWQRGQ